MRVLLLRFKLSFFVNVFGHLVNNFRVVGDQVETSFIYHYNIYIRPKNCAVPDSSLNFFVLIPCDFFIISEVFFSRKIADHKQRAHFINGTWKMLQLVYLHAFFIHWADGWLVSLCLSFVFNWHNKNRNLWSILRSVLIKSSIQIDQQTSNSNVAKYHLFHKKVIQIVYYNYVNNPLISLWLELKQTCDTLCMVIDFSQLA